MPNFERMKTRSTKAYELKREIFGNKDSKSLVLFKSKMLIDTRF